MVFDGAKPNLSILCNGPMLRLAALVFAIGGWAGVWWAWWMVATGHPLAFVWWVEVYVEPFAILGIAVFSSIVLWEEGKKWLARTN